MFTLHANCDPIHAEPFQNEKEEIFQKLADTLEQLRSVKVEEYDSDIPITIRPLLTQLKHGLRDLIFQTLNDPSFHWTVPNEITFRVLAMLQQHNILLQRPYKTPYYTYDKVYEIQISQPASHPELLVVTTTLWVMCGNDTSFYLFQRVGEAWQLIAAQEANDYEDITGAQGTFQYAISPHDEAGQFFIATAYINPWCSSNWQGLRYRIFRVGATPDQPIILVQGKVGIYQWDYTIIVQPTECKFTFWGNPGEVRRSILDPDPNSRQHVFIYKINGNHVQETQFFPEDVLDHWFVLPWEEASKWADPSLLSSLEKWHKLIQNSQYFTYYSFVQACDQYQDRWQITVDLPSDKLGTQSRQEEVSFIIIRQNERYLIQGFEATNPVQCVDEYPIDK